jgi:hypothetical protein
VHTRVVVGIAAWLAGAGTATGGSLLAVSLLGQGMAASTTQQLSVAAVNRALASEAAEAPPAMHAASPVASPTVARRPHRHHHRPAPHRTSGPDSRQATGTVLTSAGGTVVAVCQASGTYLESWSPQQGYEASSVVRGPAASAQVTFGSSRMIVTMTVTCSQGVPADTVSTRTPWGGGGDD